MNPFKSFRRLILIVGLLVALPVTASFLLEDSPERDCAKSIKDGDADECGLDPMAEELARDAIGGIQRLRDEAMD